MTSRSLDDLHPQMRPLVDLWLARCKAAGLEVLVTCTYRPQSEQDDLYAQGRTKPGKVVTWTKTSNHSVTAGGRPASLAVDFVPLVAGKPVWTATHPAWAQVGKIAEEAGLVWGGRWLAGKRDLPHVEHPQARTLRVV